MFYTYILYSSSTDKFYTGHTSYFPTSRVEQHNNGMSPSTKPGIPWVLKFYKSFQTKTEAIKFENAIKRKKSRKYIEWLIESDENEFKE
ncbi:MAG: GIY-YIG nuclease family protein [Balneolaceae bacterium]